MGQSSNINPKMIALDDHDLEKLQAVRFQVVTVIPGGPAAAIRIVNLRELVDLLGLAYQKGELVIRVQAQPLDGLPAALAAVLGFRAASPVPKEKDQVQNPVALDPNKTVVLPPRSLMDPPTQPFPFSPPSPPLSP